MRLLLRRFLSSRRFEMNKQKTWFVKIPETPTLRKDVKAACKRDGVTLSEALPAVLELFSTGAVRLNKPAPTATIKKCA